MILSDAAFGRGSGSILPDIYCYGTEGRLIDCDYYDTTDNDFFPWCTHNADVSVRCCKYKTLWHVVDNKGYLKCC